MITHTTHICTLICIYHIFLNDSDIIAVQFNSCVYGVFQKKQGEEKETPAADRPSDKEEQKEEKGVSVLVT